MSTLFIYYGFEDYLRYLFLNMHAAGDFVDSVASAVDHPVSPFSAVGIKSRHFSVDNIRRQIEGVEEASVTNTFISAFRC